MKKYDFDFKISVVEAYKNGLNYKEIREKFHVTNGTDGNKKQTM